MTCYSLFTELPTNLKYMTKKELTNKVLVRCFSLSAQLLLIKINNDQKGKKQRNTAVVLFVVSTISAR